MDANFRLVSSEDAKTWRVILDDANSHWVIRQARNRSIEDKEKWYRVLALHLHEGEPLITYRDGMSVYDIP